MALLGLLAGILYSFGGLIIDILVSFGWITSSETPGLSYGTVFAFGALIGIHSYLHWLGFYYEFLRLFFIIYLPSVLVGSK